MTPLAMKVANELTLPKARRGMIDAASVLALLDQELHCFEVSALNKSVDQVLKEEDIEREIETMLPRMFLPSPTTWLEMNMRDGTRCAFVLRQDADWFWLAIVSEGEKLFSSPICRFRARGLLESGGRIEVELLTDQGADKAYKMGVEAGQRSVTAIPPPAIKDRFNLRAEIEAAEANISWLQLRRDNAVKAANICQRTIDVFETAHTCNGIDVCVLLLDLINTPGLIGLRSHDPHRGMVRKLAGLRGGSYPLQAWSEVVLKHQTVIAGNEEKLTGSTFHKCLHFVRSHLRHYRDGHVTVIPAHWRGDPALGIKRTRYRMAA